MSIQEEMQPLQKFRQECYEGVRALKGMKIHGKTPWYELSGMFRRRESGWECCRCAKAMGVGKPCRSVTKHLQANKRKFGKPRCGDLLPQYIKKHPITTVSHDVFLQHWLSKTPVEITRDTEGKNSCSGPEQKVTSGTRSPVQTVPVVHEATSRVAAIGTSSKKSHHLPKWLLENGSVDQEMLDFVAPGGMVSNAKIRQLCGDQYVESDSNSDDTIGSFRIIQNH
jgi:hypothetical protein